MTQAHIRLAVLLFLILGHSSISLAQNESPEDPELQEEKQGFMARFKDPDDGMFDASAWLLENIVGFMPIPIIITEPAVDNGLGLAGLLFHKPKDDQMKPGDGEKIILPNMSAVAAAYTGNDSWIVGGGHFRNWGKDHYRYNLTVGYANINLDWYGNDQYAIPDGGIRFNTEGAMLDNEFLFRLGESNWFLGADWRYLDANVKFDLNLPIELPTVENVVSGLGAVALYENLDYRLSPRKGFKTELQATVNSDKIGSDFNYEQFSWKIRQYFEFGKKYTFSWRLDGSTTNGDVPFYMEPFIEMEGIPAMRFQGPTAATLEVRGGIDIHHRWTLLGFVGGGRTGDSISDLSSGTTEVAYGVGFRYLTAKVLGMRAGIDVARGPEGTYFYLVMGSAWNTGGF